MKIGYGKLSRSWPLGQGDVKTISGDIDVQRALKRLAIALPDDEFYLIGRNHRENPQAEGYPPNVDNPWEDGRLNLPTTSAENWSKEYYDSEFIPSWRRQTQDVHCDALVYWVGQVASANSYIPKVRDDDGKDANALAMNLNYTSYLLDYANQEGLEPILLCPDPRNYWKPRELMRPFEHPVLGQYNQHNKVSHEQFGQTGMPWQDPLPPGMKWVNSCLVGEVETVYGGVELTALPEPSDIVVNWEHEREHPFGIVTNENKVDVNPKKKRFGNLQEFVLEPFPDAPVFGKWSDKSLREMGRDIEPIPYSQLYDTLRSFRATITFSASGSGWITAKIWEAFACGTVMFIHQHYDDQDHAWKYYDRSKYRKLKRFLRVTNRRQLLERMRQLDDPEFHREIVAMQRELFEDAFVQWRGGVGPVIDRINATRQEKGKS